MNVGSGTGRFDIDREIFSRRLDSRSSTVSRRTATIDDGGEGLVDSVIVAHNGTMKIAFGTDEATSLTAELVASLGERGHDVLVVADGEPWPAVGRLVGEAVAAGGAERGIVCCYTGTGVAMAANKVAGARAALCIDAETARGARRWNDANVLALSLRLTTTTVADELVEAFLTTDADESERANIAAV